MARRSDGEGTAPKQRKDGIWYRAIRIEGTGKRKYLYAKSKAELDKKYKITLYTVVQHYLFFTSIITALG